MTTYTVTTTIQSRDTSNAPVEMKWYWGDSLAAAIAAMAQAAVGHDEEGTDMPDILRYRILDVRLTITEVES